MRRSGILLPVASLPSPYGIGDFGPDAYHFVDWLKKAGQHLWAVLPILVPDENGSPFDSLSAFAINWMLVSPEQLVQDGLLDRKFLAVGRAPRHRIDYDRANIVKRKIIGLSWWRFAQNGTTEMRERFAAFRQNQRGWLEEYSLFMAIKDRHSGRPWWTWPHTLKHRNRKALKRWAQTHQSEIEYFAYGQWLAHEQWTKLKRYAHARGIRILGDLPFYVTHDSVDVWANQHLFQLDGRGKPKRIAGVPPDMFYNKGQRWGNPLYRWPAMRRDHFRWWIARCHKALALYDAIRLDHFRGYEAVWSVDSHSDARHGRWEKTPGTALLTMLFRHIPPSRFIAEDLGKLTEGVSRLRERFRLPGMRITQFGFHKHLSAVHRPNEFPVSSVAYTGTHDMPTLAEWMTAHASKEERRALLAFTGGTRKTFIDDLLRATLATRSQTVILPLQDVLGIGKESRLNRPGTTRGNWTWRVPARSFSPKVVMYLRRLTAHAGR